MENFCAFHVPRGQKKDTRQHTPKRAVCRLCVCVPYEEKKNVENVCVKGYWAVNVYTKCTKTQASFWEQDT